MGKNGFDMGPRIQFSLQRHFDIVLVFFFFLFFLGDSGLESFPKIFLLSALSGFCHETSSNGCNVDFLNCHARRELFVPKL